MTWFIRAESDQHEQTNPRAELASGSDGSKTQPYLGDSQMGVVMTGRAAVSSACDTEDMQ